jgi:hypothetical protein
VRYGFVVNSGLLHALYAGVPLGTAAILALMIFSRKDKKRPATYQLSQPWTFGPVLWSAVDEVVPGGHGHGHSEVSVGGGASGRW